MLQVRGVHPVPAAEPVHLIDVAISGAFIDVDWSAVTQSDPDQPEDNWQVPYDEQELSALPDGRARAVFFFHYLDLSRPLITDEGPLPLPAVTPVPVDLRAVEYIGP